MLTEVSVWTRDVWVTNGHFTTKYSPRTAIQTGLILFFHQHRCLFLPPASLLVRASSWPLPHNASRCLQTPPASAWLLLAPSGNAAAQTELRPGSHRQFRAFISSHYFHYLQHKTLISSALIFWWISAPAGRFIFLMLWGGSSGCKVMPFHLHISASRKFTSSEESNCRPSCPSKFQNSKQFMGRICNQHSPRCTNV